MGWVCPYEGGEANELPQLPSTSTLPLSSRLTHGVLKPKPTQSYCRGGLPVRVWVTGIFELGGYHDGMQLRAPSWPKQFDRPVLTPDPAPATSPCPLVLPSCPGIHTCCIRHMLDTGTWGPNCCCRTLGMVRPGYQSFVACCIRVVAAPTAPRLVPLGIVLPVLFWQPLGNLFVDHTQVSLVYGAT